MKKQNKKLIIISAIILVAIILISILAFWYFSTNQNTIKAYSTSNINNGIKGIIGQSIPNTNNKFISQNVVGEVCDSTCCTAPDGMVTCCNEGFVMCDGVCLTQAVCDNVNGGRCRTADDGMVTCCQNAGDVFCGDTDYCGQPNNGWCLNYLAGGSHCKASDPTWCCYTAGNVVCGDVESNSCQPTEDDCKISCNPQGTACCENSGILDYNANLCCTPRNPFFVGYSNGQQVCGLFSDSFSNNYYTSQSDCYGWHFKDSTGEVWGVCGNSNYTSPGCIFTNQQFIDQYIQTSCDGTDYNKCTETSPLIFNYENLGKTIGKCGIECLIDDDCGIGNECNSNKCKQITNITVFRFADNTCSEIIIPSNQRIDNDYDTLDDCKKNIESDLIKTIIIIISILVIVSFTVFILYFIMKRIKKKR